MLVLGDVVLELVGFEEVAQLIDVVLVQLVHLLLRGLWDLLHLDGLPHCKTQRRVAGQSRGPWGRKVLLLPSLSNLFRVMNSKTLEQLQDSDSMTPPPAGIAQCLEMCWVLYRLYPL